MYCVENAAIVLVNVFGLLLRFKNSCVRELNQGGKWRVFSSSFFEFLCIFHTVIDYPILELDLFQVRDQIKIILLHDQEERSWAVVTCSLNSSTQEADTMDLC